MHNISEYQSVDGMSLKFHFNLKQTVIFGDSL